jgi:hypothetical protein
MAAYPCRIHRYVEREKGRERKREGERGSE